MVGSPDGCWHACNVCISHQHLVTGTAPAFGRALAPCNGSDLLPLRLRSTCGWVTRFYAPPQGGGFASFARLARSPLRRVPFAPRSLRAGPFGGVDPPEHCAASWLYSSNRNPLGNCISARPETGLGPDSARTRFLTSRLAAQLLCRKTGSAATPSRGTGDICLPAARAAEGRASPINALLSPVARDYPSRALGGFFMPPRCDCSIKERGKNGWTGGQSHGFVPRILFTQVAPGFCVKPGE
jgi:hypothetical protein